MKIIINIKVLRRRLSHCRANGAAAQPLQKTNAGTKKQKKKKTEETRYPRENKSISRMSLEPSHSVRFACTLRSCHE